MEVIAVTEFEELQVNILAVGIVLDAFQTTKEQSSTHHVQVVAQRVHQAHQIFRLVSFQSIVISGRGQGIVQDFIESATHQLFAYQVLEFHRFIHFSLHAQA